MAIQNWPGIPLFGSHWGGGQNTNRPTSPDRWDTSIFSHFIPWDLVQATYSVMQAFLIIILIPILCATVGAAAAIPDLDILPSLDWILGEPTVLDPVEQSLDQEHPYISDPVLDYSTELDPSIFEATPPDSTFIDPGLYDPNLFDPNSLEPAPLDPSGLDFPEISRGRPDCGVGMLGPNVPLCCDGFMVPGGAAVSGCVWHDPGKKICKKLDNVMCCQSKLEDMGFGCWKYYQH